MPPRHRPLPGDKGWLISAGCFEALTGTCTPVAMACSAALPVPCGSHLHSTTSASVSLSSEHSLLTGRSVTSNSGACGAQPDASLNTVCWVGSQSLLRLPCLNSPNLPTCQPTTCQPTTCQPTTCQPTTCQHTASAGL